MQKKFVLVTGGSGYIGSHTCIELYEAGYDFIVFDNLSNSSLESLRRVEKIIGTNVKFVEGDIRNKISLEKLFQKYRIDAVIHFAGLKSVGESIESPLEYYDNNINGSLTLLQVMQEYACKKMIFSSSANVYGNPQSVPIKEEFPIAPTNPYGRCKLFIEAILKDIHISDKDFQIILLRYFNPVGAHKSGLIGEDPSGVPNNLMPYIAGVAMGRYKSLQIYGMDYDTKDGTGVRDYIHVVDLAKGHIKALGKIDIIDNALTINLGTGKGYTVLEMVRAFELASEKKIAYEVVNRRDGDIASSYADPTKAYELLGWRATKDLNEMCEDTWRWQSKNPDGYLVKK